MTDVTMHEEGKQRVTVVVADDHPLYREGVVRALLASGSVEIETIQPSVARVVRGLPAHGVVVLRVTTGGPAARAGITAARRQVTVAGVTAFTGGDSIVAVNRKPVASSGQLSDRLAPFSPGDHLQLEVVRGSASRTVDVTLGNVPG